MKLFKKDEAFIIAEVGQNHQGDLQTARDYVRIFSLEGADAIKFQTRNNKYLFSANAYRASYTSENAFASTYGKHREHLELKPEWYPIIKDDCEKYGVHFMSTPFDEPSLELLLKFNVDIIKIASFDLGNLPFISKIAKAQKPTVMSIGGGNSAQIDQSVKLIVKNDVELAVLHCVSEYPCEVDRLGLDNIESLIKAFPNCTVGLSDHFNGILSGPIGYIKGARVFEKHVTLNRAWKGTDHSFALEPNGFRQFVRDIKRVPLMMSPKPASLLGKEEVFRKLGKSIVANSQIEEGEILKFENLTGKIFDRLFIPVRESYKVIGKTAKKTIKRNQPIEFSDLD